MNHGTWIPRLVLERADIPLSARLLYGLIDALDGDEGCFASNGWIATHLGLKPRQVQNLIKVLVDRGLVVRHIRDDKRYLMTVEKAALAKVNGDVMNCVPPTQSIAPPPRNSLHPYNTEDNTEYNSNPLPLPHGAMFRKVWDEWVAYRRAKKKQLSEPAKNKQLAMLGGMTEAEAIECINRSISNDWQGLFPEQLKKHSKPFSKILTPDDHSNGF